METFQARIEQLEIIMLKQEDIIKQQQHEQELLKQQICNQNTNSSSAN